MEDIKKIKKRAKSMPKKNCEPAIHKNNSHAHEKMLYLLLTKELQLEVKRKVLESLTISSVGRIESKRNHEISYDTAYHLIQPH